MKKITKRLIKTTLFVTSIAIIFSVGYLAFLYLFSPVEFSPEKITDSTLSINLYDSEQRPLEHTFVNGDYVKLSQIPKQTIECFISIEDKKFYKHKGINYKRIMAAVVKNISSFSFKEGASTISQQLIKNTHLTSEKSIKRKINEIKLTKKLETAFSKDQILEYYLNVIYFGDNCYGIQNASKHYFSKPVSKLSLDESAILAGIIKSPNKYHPIKQYNNCISRRNVVLTELFQDGKIDSSIYEKYKNVKTEIDLNTEKIELNSYAKTAIKEAENILKMPEKQIEIGGYRIFTYMNKEKQKAIENSIDNSINEDCSMISMNSSTGNVEAYVEKSNLPLYNVARQPASTIKPILVYAPAINENIVSPSTVILDENITINGYQPKNIGNKEHGYVSVKTALCKSLNIPAVKILGYVGIEKAKTYLTRQNIVFDEKDSNLALALGGMTYGMTLKDLTNCYQTLANNGNYINSKFIDYIVDKNGKVIYKNAHYQKTIYRQDTAYLVTDILHSSTKNGTAKRLNELNYYVASKTGTSSVSKNNLDAYNISYTTEDVVGCWIGNLDNSSTQIVGGGLPSLFVKNYFEKIYAKSQPEAFQKPSSVVVIDIDTISRDVEHIIYKANDLLPERYREKALFSRFNPPKEKELNKLTIEPAKINGKIDNNNAIINFDALGFYSYDVYIVTNGKEKLLTTITNKNGLVTYKVNQSPNILCRYYVKTKAKNYRTNSEIESDSSNVLELYYKG